MSAIPRSIDLKYGRTTIPFEYDESRFEVLQSEDGRRALSDAEIGQKLEDPIDCLPLDEIVSPGESVLIVVPDATREVGAATIVNLVIRRLIAGGVPPTDIRIIFATGIHRQVTEEEKQSILSPFIAQRIRTLDHDPRDLARLVRVGQTRQGIPVEVNRALTEHNHVVLVGGVIFHYFAGFTGGRKLICPGLASAGTVSMTHKLAFDCETGSRRKGVDTGLLDGNAVHEAFVDAVSLINPEFAVNTIVDDAGNVIDLFCGDWITSHRKACEAYADSYTVRIAEKRDLVVAACGGYPHDINMIQAHKTLEAASHACRHGGTMILLAECADGLGRNDFIDWFDVENSSELVERLCRRYQVNGQTAWSLLTKAERFDIRIISALNAATAEKMKLTPMQSLTRAIAKVGLEKGYILPDGAKLHVVAE